MDTFLLLARVRLSAAWLVCRLLAWLLYQRWIVTAAWFTCWINLQIHKGAAMSHGTINRQHHQNNKHTTVLWVWPLGLLLSGLPPLGRDGAASLGRHWRVVVWGGGSWREILLRLCQGAVILWNLVVCCGLQDVAERRKNCQSILIGMTPCYRLLKCCTDDWQAGDEKTDKVWAVKTQKKTIQHFN